MELLTCTRCKAEKPATGEFFPPHNKTKTGFDSWCRSCRSTYRSEIRRGRYRAVISDDQLKNLIAETKECTICGITDVRLCVDHDHTTGAVRGMLCDNCNQGLGKFKDDAELLEFARIYLLSSRGDKEAEEYIEEKSDELRRPHQGLCC